MNFKQINKTLFILLISVSIIVFSSFTSSHAKYFDKKENALKYNFNVIALESTKSIIVHENDNTSTKSDISLYFDFSRSKNMNSEDTSDVYTVTVSDGCEINTSKITTKGEVTQGNEKNKVTITYNDKDTDIDTNTEKNPIRISYTCKTQGYENLEETIDGKRYYVSNVTIKEKFMPENVEFKYIEGASKIEADPYDLRYAPTGSVIDENLNYIIIYNTTTDKVGELDKFINLYKSKYSVTNNSLNTYITDKVDLETKTAPEGITIGDTTYEGYGAIKVIFDDTLLSRADTYTFNKTSTTKFFYFYNNLVSNNYKILWEDYIDTYVEASATDKDKLKQYISDNGGYTGLITEDTKGFTLYSGDNYVYYSIDNKIFNIIDKVVEIKYGEYTSATLLRTKISSKIRTLYDDKTVPDSCISLIKNYNNGEIINDLFANRIVFNKTYNITDNGIQYTVTTYSDGLSSNYLKIEKVATVNESPVCEAPTPAETPTESTNPVETTEPVETTTPTETPTEPTEKTENGTEENQESGETENSDPLPEMDEQNSSLVPTIDSKYKETLTDKVGIQE